MIGESEGLIRSHKRGKSPTGKYQSQPALGTKECNKSFGMTKPEKFSERLKYSLLKFFYMISLVDIPSPIEPNISLRVLLLFTLCFAQIY